MNPTDRKYTKSHEWLMEVPGGYRIGLTDFAQSSLGDIVFVGLPAVDDAVTAEASFGDVESVKAVSEMLSPVSGTVMAVNEDLLVAPENVNVTPYEAWLIEVSGVTETAELLDAAAYEALCAAEA